MEHENSKEFEVLGHVRVIFLLLIEDIVYVPKVTRKLELAYGLAVYAKPFSYRNEMGRAVEAGAESVLVKYRLGEGARRALALRSRHVDHRQTVQLF